MIRDPACSLLYVDILWLMPIDSSLEVAGRDELLPTCPCPRRLGTRELAKAWLKAWHEEFEIFLREMIIAQPPKESIASWTRTVYTAGWQPSDLRVYPTSWPSWSSSLISMLNMAWNAGTAPFTLRTRLDAPQDKINEGTLRISKYRSPCTRC